MEPNDNKQHHYVDDIELTFSQEFSFFLQFFLHLIILYSICYLSSMIRFVRDQFNQLVARVCQPLGWPFVMALPPFFVASTRQMGQASGLIAVRSQQSQASFRGQQALSNRRHPNSPVLTFGQICKMTFRI